MIPKGIQKEVMLAPLTTFKIGGIAEYYIEVRDIKILQEAVDWAKQEQLPITILGGGSNILVSDDGVRGLVIHPVFDEVTYEEKGDIVLASAGAGKIFDKLVSELAERDFWGLENLSGIPGSVGATPVQNVGAYGVEVGEHIDAVVAYDIHEDKLTKFNNSECCFGYRDSFFKNEGKGRYVIVKVVFKLSTRPNPKLTYKDLKDRFREINNPKLQEIRDVVIEIRAHKFPNLNEVGTAGSFFKNPVISCDQFKELITRYPDIPHFETENDQIKIPLGWVLDKVLGLNGCQEGSVGLYEKQALVVINHGDATAAEVRVFAESVIQKIKDATGIVAEWEVRFLE